MKTLDRTYVIRLLRFLETIEYLEATPSSQTVGSARAEAFILKSHIQVLLASDGIKLEVK